MIFKPEPAHEFFLKEGAEHTFLNSLLRDVEKSRNVNAWLYKYKVPGQAAFYGAAVCATCVSVGLLPLQMQWVFILALLDLCRQLFKLNANAMVMCTSNVFGFWIPCLVRACAQVSLSLFLWTPLKHHGPAVCICARMRLPFYNAPRHHTVHDVGNGIHGGLVISRRRWPVVCDYSILFFNGHNVIWRRELLNQAN